MGRVRVVLACGIGWESALGGAVRGLEGMSWTVTAEERVVLLCASDGAREPAEYLAERVRGLGADASIEVMTPPSLVSGLVRGWAFGAGRGARRLGTGRPHRVAPTEQASFQRPTTSHRADVGARWVMVDVAGRGGRFDRVGVPRVVAEADVVGVVATFDNRADRPGMLVIGGLAAYAQPRLALAARLDRGRAGVAADIAVAYSPLLFVVVGTVRGYAVAVSTTDLIAAELVGLALRQEDGGVEAVGPWEDATVQRATELRLGVRLPGEIDLVPVWAGPLDGPGGAVVEGLAARVRLRLGIPAP